jgi:predicted chitinase
MAQLDHDSATGFLRGESIADEVEQIAQELKLLRSIDANTSDIARRLGQLSQGRPAVQPGPAGARRSPIIVNNAANDPAAARSSSRSSSRSSGSVSSSRRNRAGMAGERMAATPRQAGARDASGKFTGGGSAKGGGEGAASESSARGISSSIADAARDIGNSLKADVDNVDPTIQAAKELSGILSPAMALFKPLGRLFGRNKDAQQTKQHRESVTWLRRIWRGQEDAGKEKGRGGMGGMLGMLLALVGAVLAPFKALGRLLGVGRMMKAASSLMPGRSRGARGGVGARAGRNSSRNSLAADGLPGADIGGKGKAGEAGGRAGRASAAGAKSGGLKGLAKGAGGGLLKMGKGLLRKLPLIGALFGGAMIASDAMASDDPELSKDENKKNKWGNVGSGVGGLVGGALGMFGGPAGAIVGGMIGDQLGGMVGKWLSTVDLGSVVSSISTTFSTLADTASKAASAAFEFVKTGWDGLVTSGTKAISGMADWARETWKNVTDKVAEWKDTAADKVQSAKDYVGDKAASVKDAGSNVLYKASGGSLGTGGSDARKAELVKAMDAGGITDQNSKAALMANMDHESGGFTKKEENLNYSAKRLREVFPKYYKSDEDARADAGNPEAIGNKVYGGRMGNVDPGDGYKFRGRGDTQLTGRAQYEAMGKKLGVDLVNNPELAADPKYSAQIAVQNWKSSGADKLAQAGDMVGARKRINGGTNGLEDVNSKFDGYLAQAKAGDLTPTRRADELKVAAPTGVNAAVASTMASVASPKSLAGAQAATPIGIMAPTQARAAAVASASIPATLAAPKMGTYAPAAADASQMKIPAVPEIKTPTGSGGGKEGPTSVNVELPLSQNVGDRGIAHASAGGLGMYPL